MAPSKPEYADLTIQELWDAAEQSFQKTTGANLKSGSSHGLESAMARLEARYGSGKADGHAKTRRIIFNVLKVIENLGGLVMQGASMAFPPASLCFSAVSFLLDIPQRIDNVFGSVGSLFEAIEGYLVKLEIYKRIEKLTKLDGALLRSIHIILISLVDICALAHRLAFGSKTSKFKTGTLAVLRHDDSGVSGALTQFNDLINQQNALVVTLMYEQNSDIKADTSDIKAVTSNIKADTSDIKVDTSDIKDHTQYIPGMAAEVTEIRNIYVEGMETLVTDVQTRSNDKSADEQRGVLIKALDISKETIEEQEKILEGIRNDSLPDSGAELHQDPRFLRWIDFTSDVKPTLFLRGEPRSGKSYLIHSILDAVKSGTIPSGEGNTSISRTAVAQYFFQKPDDRTRTTNAGLRAQSDRPLEIALKHMCFQIAQQHRGYAKEISTTLKSFRPRGRTTLEIWEKLLLGRPRGDVAHVLVFDGIDQISEDDVEALFQILEMQQALGDGSSSSFPGRSKLRILVSSTPKLFQATRLLDVPVLDAIDMNTTTVRSFIEQELSTDKTWQEDTASTRALADFIREELPKRSNGDFGVIMQALDSVKKAVEDGRGLQKARLALEEACEQDPNTIASNIIEDLCKSLNAQDIKRLNNLLMWTMWNRARLSLEELRAVSFLESRDDPCQSFETIMRTKYSRIFTISSDETVIVRDEIDTFLQSKPGLRGHLVLGADSSGPKISMEIKITNATMDQVRRFLWNLNERANLEPFLFDTTAAAVDEKAIEAYPVDSAIHVTVKILELLNDEYNDITEPLFPHAILNVNDNLRQSYERATDGLLEPDEIRAILSGIIAFLTDTDILEQHILSPTHIQKAWLDEQEEFLDHILYMWLTFAEGIALLNRKDQRDLRNLMNPQHGYYLSFYRPFTMMMAKRWLRAINKSPVDAFKWIDGFIESDIFWSRESKRSGTRQLERTKSVESVSSSLASMDLSLPQRINRALSWVKHNMIHIEEDDLWFQRVGNTYLHMDEYDRAIEQFDAGKLFSTTNWHLFGGSALAYAGKKDFDRAIEEGVQGLQMIRSKPDVDLKSEFGYMLVVRRLAVWYSERGQHEKAIEECVSALLVDPYNSAVQYYLLDVRRQLGEKSQIKDYLTVELAEPGDDGKSSKIDGLVTFTIQQYIDEGSLLTFERTMLAARSTESVPTILQSLRRLNLHEIEEQGNKETRTSASLNTRKLFESIILGYAPNLEPESPDLSIQLATEIITTPQNIEQYEDNDKATMYVVREAHDLLAESYFRRMVAAVKGDGDHSQYISKMEDVIAMSRTKTGFLPQGLTYLAAFYVQIGEKEKARDLLRPFLEEALDMLVDDTPDNDPDAFYFVALILGYLQDDYNSLTAWSLCAPFQGRDTSHLDSESESGSDLDSDTEALQNDEVDEADPSSSDRNTEHDAGSTQSEEEVHADTEHSNGDLQHGGPADAPANGALPVNNTTTSVADPEDVPSSVGSDTLQGATDENSTSQVDVERRENDEVTIRTDDTGSSHDGDSTIKGTDEDDRPTWIRVSRRHLLPETLAAFKLRWDFDPDDGDFIIIKEFVAHELQAKIFRHTKRIMMRRKHPHITIDCAAGCGKTWTYADDIYVCKYCRVQLLCESCLAQVKDLDRRYLRLCSPDHDWLHVPKWSNEWAEDMGKDEVRIGGEIGPDGRIIGGEKVAFQAWLNTIRKEWGLSILEAEYRWVQKV